RVRRQTGMHGRIRAQSRPGKPIDSRRSDRSRASFVRLGINASQSEHGPSRCAGAPPRSARRESSAGLRVALTGVADEPGLALLEPEVHLAGGPVAVLRELELHDLAVLLGVLPRSLLVAPEEQHQVGVLLDRTGLAQVGEAGLLALAHLWLAGQVGQGDDRDRQLGGERLEPTADLGALLHAGRVAG